MNKIIINHPNLNNGEETILFTAMSEKQNKTQIAEIFSEEHYKKGRIKKNMTIIDCGANIGLASLYFKDWAKEIYAIEPSSQHYQALVKNVAPYKHIKTFNFGLGAQNTQEVLSSNDAGDIPESLFGRGTIHEQITLITLEQFMQDNKITHVDLLKIDTEGAEYVIFPSLGFKKVAHNIDYIIGEGHQFEKLIPEFIPLILADAGFDTKFLPFDNIYFTMSFDDSEAKSEYTVNKQTIFFAKRKELEWPN